MSPGDKNSINVTRVLEPSSDRDTFANAATQVLGGLGEIIKGLPDAIHGLLIEWIHDVLGPLASSTESDQRLRDTLRVFLRVGSSFKSAAGELQIHANTVKYRVNRAVERRGQPIDNDRLDVEFALLMCDWFGDAVLT